MGDWAATSRRRRGFRRRRLRLRLHLRLRFRLRFRLRLRNRVFGVAMKRIRGQRPFHRGRCRRVRHQKRRWTSQRAIPQKALDKSACNALHRHSLANRHAETSSTHHRDRSGDDGSHLPPTLRLPEGEWSW